MEVVLAESLRAVRTDGVAVGVTSEQTTVFGAAGRVAGEPVDDQAMMYGASVAKQFIGLLMAQAIEAGHVTEDDRLIGSLPELPDWMAEIRLRHLLHHTSGLADVTAPSRGVPASNAEVLERLQRHPQPALDSLDDGSATTTLVTSCWLRSSAESFSGRSVRWPGSRSSGRSR